MLRRLSIIMTTALLLVAAVLLHPKSAADAEVTVDRNVPVGVSQLDLGITHTHFMWEQGDLTAAKRGKTLVNAVSRYNNQHLMGWGTDNPQPKEGGPYDWSSLDSRIGLFRTLDGEMVITFCTAPGWMKTSGEDWNMEDRVADEHVDDFAALAAAAAERYPDVKYFVIWNEMKGYWNSSMNNWDYVRYTDMYNSVYNAVKSVRPDARVGGYYAVIQGDASETLGYSGAHTEIPVMAMDHTSMEYWLANKAGADFIAVDYALHDFHNPNEFTEADGMNLTWTFEKVEKDIRAKTDLPIWWSEYYTLPQSSINGSPYMAALMGSVYINMIKGDTGGKGVVALLWNPEEGEIPHYLFTDTETSSGGQATPHYDVFKAFADHFGPGTTLYETTSSSASIEAIASGAKTLIVNKSSASKTVDVDGTVMTMAGYEVRVMDN